MPKYVVLILDDLITTCESDSQEQIDKMRRLFEEIQPFLTGKSHVVTGVKHDFGEKKDA